MSVITVLVVAVWLVYSDTRTFIQTGRAGRELAGRRDMVDSLVCCFLEMSNSERAVCLGRTAQWDAFDRSLRQTLALADTLGTLVDGKRRRERIDSLKTLLVMKRENVLRIMEDIAAYNSDAFFKKKVSSLQRGGDSVLIHPKELRVNEEKEIVYDVVKSKKGFFARLADVFRKQRSDTIAVSEVSRKTVSDSARHSIDIADTVAGVLEEIRREEMRDRVVRRKGYERREQARQMVGVRLAGSIEQLLKEIRDDEQARFKAVFDADVRARRAVMMKIVMLTVLAVLAVAVLLYYVSRDMRRARIYQENLKQAKAETERVMAQRERLLLTITHDIKAPAASISGFIELLEGHVSGTKAASYLRNIKHSATHLLSLVGSLLEYHRLENGKVEVRQASFSPRRLVMACVDSVRPQASAKGLSLRHDVSGCPSALCRGDAFRIKQVLDNLISNAMKYTSEGSVGVTAAVNDSRLLITVADTGCGMTPDEARRVFNAFTRLPGAQGIEGVGLGLSITKEIVALLGGRVTVESEKGKGTVFRVSLPVAMTDVVEPDTGLPDDTGGAEDAAAPAGGFAGAMPAEGVKVLILDDDRLQLKLLGEMLARLSGGRWSVTACSRAEEAMRAFGAERPDVFFIDIEMPGASGLDIAGSITGREGMKLIAMTAHEPSIGPRLVEAGFDACLFKPFSMARLADALAGFAVDGGHDASSAPEAKPTSRFAALTAYAGDDAEAAREILGSFASDLGAHIARLRKAMPLADRGEIAAVAHKALPLLELVGSAVTAMLKALLPEHIDSVDDSVIMEYCNKIIAEMEEMEREIKN